MKQVEGRDESGTSQPIEQWSNKIEQWRNEIKFVIQGCFSVIFLLFALFYLLSLSIWGYFGHLDVLLEEHILATIGIPLAIMSSATIVAIFELQSGEIKFEVFHIKYEGSSGQIILWVVCFLSIVGGLKILW